MSGMDSNRIVGTPEVAETQRVNVGEPKLHMEPVQQRDQQELGLPADQGFDVSSQGLGSRGENLPTEPIGDQRTVTETVGGHVYVPVVPITDERLEGAHSAQNATRSTEYGEVHPEGKKPMGQKIKEMLPGTEEHKMKKAEERGTF